jgi:hypothetical protein
MQKPLLTFDIFYSIDYDPKYSYSYSAPKGRYSYSYFEKVFGKPHVFVSFQF